MNRTASKKMRTRLSVVIPVAQGEQAWQSLLPQLGQVDTSIEILLCGPSYSNEAPPTAKNVFCAGGRGAQMNEGARQAQGDWLWFLHADSRLNSKKIFTQLTEILKRDDEALYYFWLRFDDESPIIMNLNGWGANVRSALLKIPFGDQGFLLPKKLWERLQGFPENAPYGEDHLFVWKARRAGIPVLPAGASISTSARKYMRHGWFTTTIRHFYLTWKQAFPEWIALLKNH